MIVTRLTPTFMFEKQLAGNSNSIERRLGYYRNIIAYLYANKYLMPQFKDKTEIVSSELLDNATLMDTMAHTMNVVLKVN
jgi:hypothetical protein